MESSCRCTLNVGGQLFTTTADTLRSLPNTRLGRLVQDVTFVNQKAVELFFDRNPEIVNNLLDLYRYGELHLPSNLCGDTVKRELEFWEIPSETIRECCYSRVKKQKDDAKMIAEVDHFLSSQYETPAEIEELSSWNKIWLIMERPNFCRASKVWNAIYFIVVFLSVLLYCFETSFHFREFSTSTLEYAARLNLSVSVLVSNGSVVDVYGLTVPHLWLRHSQQAILIFFLLELLVRLLTCPSKVYFLKQAKNWFDAFLIVQSSLAFLLEEVILKDKLEWTRAETDAIVFFYSLTVARLLRIFYLAKNFDAMKILLLSTRASLKVLMLLAICVLSLATIFGAAVFLAEMLTDQFTFSSIPYAMWYAIVTMTTVGYGDVVPVSSVGRLLGVLCALCGVIVMALPIAVIASNFTGYHDNISSRQQRRTRMAFFKENPDFRKVAESGERKEKSHHFEDGKHLPEKRRRQSDGDIVEEKQGSVESNCFRLGLFRRETKKIGTHPIHVSDSRSRTQNDGTDLELSEDALPNVKNTHCSSHFKTGCT